MWKGGIIDIKEGKSYKIVGYDCGYKCRHKFNVMGLNEGRVFKLSTKEILNGPYVIKVDNNELSVGRGLFEKLIIEEVKNER